ncbi:MAG: F0F1 ATP synthase subunit alpha [Butyrivibrio sp.]|nr:F0F1 ATP synthase subunit alpha [Butyrivibrio sp.]
MSEKANRNNTPQEPQKVIALLRYDRTPPTAEQLKAIRDILSERLWEPTLEVVPRRDMTVDGGFIIDVGGVQYDWSDQGRGNQLARHLEQGHRSAADPTSGGLISILKEEVERFELQLEEDEVGHVSYVGDGIALIAGIDHAFYGEIIVFDDGTKGMVMDIRETSVGCILFGKENGLREGSKAIRTFRQAGIPVGEAFLGRVVDALGAPLDGGEEIRESGYRPVEQPAPGIIDREPVSEPMETGILSIDTMFPIGRGQRELIIGDRQTGKTSIALDTILNQKNGNVICIYVAIGQKASTIARLINTLKTSGAMEYTIVVSSTAADPAPLQYIAPYAGTALAEYFMHEGKDVLIVYDDLSKHAVAYRSLSLLLERPPGREAYPGDVFYLHSRLLERASKLSRALGGGSITALPIIETQGGDVSAYIPTNVISITDGQIFLEADLFFGGMRPAVNVGLSVSRVGSAAQCRAMKRASGSIRIDLAQYREMAVFTQFSSDLDEITQRQLRHGEVLMELLKQPLGHPLSMEEQVILLVLANSGLMDMIPKARVAEVKRHVLRHFKQRQQQICKELSERRDLSDNLKSKILAAGEAYLERERKG